MNFFSVKKITGVVVTATKVVVIEITTAAMIGEATNKAVKGKMTAVMTVAKVDMEVAPKEVADTEITLMAGRFDYSKHKVLSWFLVIMVRVTTFDIFYYELTGVFMDKLYGDVSLQKRRGSSTDIKRRTKRS